MTPQPGDIWQYKQSDSDNGLLIVLIHEHMGSHPSHFSEGIEHSYYGYDMLTDSYDEFYFNDSNMKHWKKLG